MGDCHKTRFDRLCGWLHECLYRLGMWLAVRYIYPDADPHEFCLLDTAHFVAIPKEEAAAAGLLEYWE
jgi:hypothetical protein